MYLRLDVRNLHNLQSFVLRGHVTVILTLPYHVQIHVASADHLGTIASDYCIKGCIVFHAILIWSTCAEEVLYGSDNMDLTSSCQPVQHNPIRLGHACFGH